MCEKEKNDSIVTKKNKKERARHLNAIPYKREKYKRDYNDYD